MAFVKSPYLQILKFIIMKKNLLLLVLLIAGALGLNAQTISGTVTDLNANGIGNQQVFVVSNDSINPFSTSTYTVGSGAYSFSNVPSCTLGFKVYVYDCQQSVQIVSLAANSGTADFAICTSNPSSCSAIFSASPSSSNANLINFVDYSTGNPTSWTWSFGDGSNASTQNPSHTYAAAGTYTVTLNISNASSSDSYSTTITVVNTTACSANFNSDADSVNTSMIFFYDTSTGNPTSWSWNFGDGSTANTQFPIHTYAATGSYTVTLSIASANCNDTYSQTVNVGVSQPAFYTVAGTVMANNVAVTTGVVSLFDVANNTIVATAILGQAGSYFFGNVAAANYIIYAIADSASLSGYVTTYYGDVALWSTATQINVNANQSGIDINLIAAPSTPGNGSISGNVGTASKAGTDGLSVFLTDANSNNVLVASTFTNNNGDYSFNNIVDGTFNIWVDVAGKTATPITVTLNNGSTTSTDNDFIMGLNTIAPKPTSVNSNAIIGKMKLYPNPVVNVLNVELNIEQSSTYSFNVYSVSGQLVSSQTMNVASGSSLVKINTNDLSQGTYILRIENRANQTMQKLFVK